jgi:tetratricopeptide (TPR) repeat protein
MTRSVWLAGLLLSFGCHSLSLPNPKGPGESAQVLWQQGQEAMRQGQNEHAVALYQQSLHKDKNETRNHLSLAAAYVAQGKEDAACVHLAQFLQTNPDHPSARLYLAELLMRRGEHSHARHQFDQIIAQAQDQAQEDLNQLLHCHGRVTEIAQVTEDEYTLHLHRGIGLFLLARSLTSLGMDQNVFSSEALLCKAAAELVQARNLRPEEAKPSKPPHSPTFPPPSTAASS